MLYYYGGNRSNQFKRGVNIITPQKKEIAKGFKLCQQIETKQHDLLLVIYSRIDREYKFRSQSIGSNIHTPYLYYN